MSLSFILASVFITLLPGPSMLVVMLNTIQKGGWSGVVTACGVVIADALLLMLTLSGIGALLYTSSLAFSLVKWLGVGYLLFLGIRQLKSAASEGRTPANTEPRAAGKSPLLTDLAQGVGTTLLNPKIIGFFIAFFPQFLDPATSVLPQLLIMGPVFLLIVLLILLLYVILARTISAALSSARGQKILHKFSAGLLIFFGLLAATVER